MGLQTALWKMGSLWCNRGWCLLLLMTVADIQGHPSKKRTYIEIFYNQDDVTLQEARHKCYTKDEHLYLPMLNTTAKILLYKTLKLYSQSSYGSSTFEFWTNATSDGTTCFWDNYPNCTELPPTSSLWASTFTHSENAAYFKVESNLEYGLYRALNTETMGMVICEKEQESCEYIGESSDECPSLSTESSTTVISGLNEIRKCSERCDHFMSGEAECWGFLYSDTTQDCTLLYHINPLLLTHIETNSNCQSSYPEDIKFYKKKCHFVNFDSGTDSPSSSANLRNTCTTALTFLTTPSSTTSTTTDQTRTTTTALITSSTIPQTTTMSTPMEPSTTTLATTITLPTTTSTTIVPPTTTLTTTTLPTTTSTTMAPPSSTLTTTTTLPTTTSTTMVPPTSTTTIKTASFTTTTNSSLTTSLTTATTSAPPTTTLTSTLTTANTTVAQTNMTSTTIMSPVFATTTMTLTTAISNITDTSFSTTIPVTTTLPSTSHGVSHYSSAINPTMLYICSCLCSSQSSSNLTIEEKINIIFRELMIDASQTSATIRSKTSAEDERPSSVSIGIVSIVLLLVVTVLTHYHSIPTFDAPEKEAF